MTSKRLKVSIIYFVVVVLTLLFRIASALDIYSALGIENDDAFWSCIIQIVIFGAIPFCLYMIFVAGKEDRLLPYFPVKATKNKVDNDEQEDKIQNTEQSAFLAVEREYVREQEVPQVPQDNLSNVTENVDSQENVAPAEDAQEAEPAQNMQDASTPKTNKQKAKEAFSAFVHDFGFKKVSLKNALFTVVLAVCMIIIGSAISFLWQAILSLIGYTAIPSQTEYDGLGSLFLQLFLVAVLPGLFEEFSHRGLLFAGYKESGWKFVLLSALYFSLMHQNIRQTGYTFVDGLAMALAMYYTGSIWPGVFMHFLNNAWSVFLGYVSDVGGAFGFIISIDNWLYSTIGGLIVCVCVVLLAIIFASLVFLAMRKDAVKKGRISDNPFEKAKAYSLTRDLMFWLTVAVGVVATVFSLVWGIGR